MKARIAGGTLALLVAIASSVVTGAGPVAAQPLDNVGAGVAQAVGEGEPVEVFVMLEGHQPQGDPAELRASAAEAQDEVIDELGGDVQDVRRFQTVPAFTAQVDSEDALRRLAAQPGVRQVDLNLGAGTGSLANSVPIISADDLQAGGITGEGITVAVLDTGHDTDHPDLAGAVVHEECFGEDFAGGFCPNGTVRQSGAGAAEDDAGHGTHVTGIVTSDGVVSSVGVAPDADILAIKVTDNCGYSGCFYTFAEITAALDFIADNPQYGVDVVNMSLGTNALFTGDCDAATSWLMAADAVIDNLNAQGVVSVAAAGNNGSTTLMSAPGCLSGVVSVGATNTADAVTSFSNTSSTTDVLAPGNNVISDAIGGGLFTASGTSMASPTVAGCVALLKEAAPTASVAAIESALESTGLPVTRGLATYPRIDCAAAAAALAPEPSGPRVAIGDATIVEGDANKTRRITFAVTLSEPATAITTVQYTIGEDGSPAAATNGVDFKAKIGTLTFKPALATGKSPTVKFVTALVYPDQSIEDDETFQVTLSNPTGGFEISGGPAVATILDDDPVASSPQIAVGDASIVEGDQRVKPTSVNNTKVWVNLSDVSTETVTVTVTFTAGTAVEGVDFKAVKTKTLTFKPGQRDKPVTVPVYADETVDGDQTVLITLSNATGGATIGRSVGTVTIVDDD